MRLPKGEVDCYETVRKNNKIICEKGEEKPAEGGNVALFFKDDSYLCKDLVDCTEISYYGYKGSSAD